MSLKFWNILNLSCGKMALWLTQPLTEMTAKQFFDEQSEAGDQG
jgi:hypothetical protein